MKQLEMLETTDERRCCVCKEVKKEEEFTYHKKQGRQAQCKECRRELNKKYREENRERCRALCKKHREENRELYRESSRKHYQKNKQTHKERVRDYARSSIKTRVVSAANYAIKTGKLIRQPCEVCGAEKVDAHHDDYAKPLEVRWLCRSHHKQHHADWGEAVNACTVRHWTPTQELKS